MIVVFYPSVKISSGLYPLKSPPLWHRESTFFKLGHVVWLFSNTYIVLAVLFKKMMCCSCLHFFIGMCFLSVCFCLSLSFFVCCKCTCRQPPLYSRISLPIIIRSGWSVKLFTWMPNLLSSGHKSSTCDSINEFYWTSPVEHNVKSLTLIQTIIPSHIWNYVACIYGCIFQGNLGNSLLSLLTFLAANCDGRSKLTIKAIIMETK